MDRAGLLAVAALALALAGCGHGGDGDVATTPATSSGTATASPLPRPTASVPTATLPGLVGKGLQTAQETANAAGFTEVHSHDALGKGRAQVVDRDWKVCFSRPAAGKVEAGTVVELAAVRVSEACPAKDLGLPVVTAAPAVMPDLRGKSLRVAREALGVDTTIDAKDAKAGRSIILAASWRVCTQSPAPGRPLAGAAVTLTVVKFGETC